MSAAGVECGFEEVALERDCRPKAIDENRVLGSRRRRARDMTGGEGKGVESKQADVCNASMLGEDRYPFQTEQTGIQ